MSTEATKLDRYARTQAGRTVGRFMLPNSDEIARAIKLGMAYALREVSNGGSTELSVRWGDREWLERIAKELTE